MKYRAFLALLLAALMLLLTACGEGGVISALTGGGTSVTDAAQTSDPQTGKDGAGEPAEKEDAPQPETKDEGEKPVPTTGKSDEGGKTAASKPEETESAEPAAPDAPSEPEGGDEPADGTEPEPEDDPEARADYAALAGIWFCEETQEALTLYENGGFLLQSGNTAQWGFLRYTEEEGSMWDPVPRYELYLESNERMYGDPAVSLDEQYPGRLCFTMGGGAVLFSRDVPDNSTTDALVQAWYVTGPWIDCTVAEISQDEPVIEVLFTAAGDVQDFRILSLAFEDVDADGNPVFRTAEVYRQDTLPGGWPVLAVLTFYGDIPNNGISYTDADGETHYYSLSMSGFDGSLVLSEFAPAW